eukprot:13924004-Alexandrium_andersonii.AAC.1
MRGALNQALQVGTPAQRLIRVCKKRPLLLLLLLLLLLRRVDGHAVRALCCSLGRWRTVCFCTPATQCATDALVAMPILVTAPPSSQHCHSSQWPARDVQTSGACLYWASPG